MESLARDESGIFLLLSYMNIKHPFMVSSIRINNKKLCLYNKLLIFAIV